MGYEGRIIVGSPTGDAKAYEELVLALLGEFVETCNAEGISYYEGRANAWMELLRVNLDEHKAAWEARREELWAMSDAKYMMEVKEKYGRKQENDNWR